ncbi:MAG: hypothetical protein ACK2UK_03715 [Candidatus Promineifilaceae bacterium]
MLPESAKRIIGQQIDRATLYAINRRIPENGADGFRCSVTLEEVLAQTAVTAKETPAYQITAPGEHRIKLTTRLGEIDCLISVRPAAQAQAPLFIYHHGLAEYPYTSSWQRLIPKDVAFPAHTVVVQAPYHHNMSDPLRLGFASVEHIYQMFAGSLRIMRTVQEQFEEQGAAFTVIGGLSWGGITSLLYEGIFDVSRATVPMFASPKLSQAIWDASEMFNRRLPVKREELDELLDFTSLYQHIDQHRVFPVMGEHDVFFRLENHASVYDQEALLTVPSTHVGAMWAGSHVLREHLLKTMAWAADNPR